jgi:hypothetical protein
MNLIEKFKVGKENNTYQRLDTAFKVNFYVGYNEDGMMSLVIVESGKELQVKSTKVIKVSSKPREDGKIALAFELLDESYQSLFLMFCKDIIISCESVGRENANANAITRWKYWKEMFSKRSTTVLDEGEIKGLVGELIFLKEHFLVNYHSDVAISSWMGPLYGHKDFEIDDTWYEIKSVNENAIQVMINSLEQLESEQEGHLVIIRLEKANSVTSGTIDLNSIVFEIIEKLIDLDDLNLFNQKLNNVGYVYDEEYDKYKFLHKGTQQYLVNDKFPRIRRKELFSEVGNVKYTIMIDGISELRE